METRPDRAEFPATRWSEVAAAGQAANEAGRAALDRLLSRYWLALYLHLRGKYRLAEAEAEDCLQSFLLERVLERTILARADRTRGRFRTFLLNALDNFYLNTRRNAQARRRTPPGGWLPLDELQDFEPPDHSPHPARAFDLAWAITVLEETRRRMGAECRRSGRLDIWGIYDGMVLGPVLEGEDPPTYDDLVGRLGLPSATQASNLRTTGRRMFERLLWEVLAEEAEDDAEVERLMQELKEILASPNAE